MTGDLVLPPELQWIADFDQAVSDGMGLRIPLTEAQAREGFDRVLVVYGLTCGQVERGRPAVPTEWLSGKTT